MMSWYQERLKRASGSITQAITTIKNLGREKSKQIFVINKEISSTELDFEKKSKDFVETFLWTIRTGSNWNGNYLYLNSASSGT